MAKVEIKPHTGLSRRNGQLVPDCDTGIDAVWIESPELGSGPKMVGFTGRDPGCPFNPIRQLSESLRGQVADAIAAHRGDADGVKVNKMPRLEEAPKQK